jgi:hypothetical protein
VRPEAPAWRHAVVVDDPQAAEAHEPRVHVVGEGERVVTVEPAVVGVASLVCASNGHHGETSVIVVLEIF